MANPSLKLPVDVEDLALELGATVRHSDGSVFNSAGRSGVTRLRKPTVEPAPAPAPVQQSGHEQLTTALLEMMQKLHVPQSAPPTVNVAPAQVTVQPQTRCSWEFSFTRNPDGTIKSIKATPVKE